MSESNAEGAADADADADAEAEAEATGRRTGQHEACQRCGRKQGLVGKYDIWLCRQCFREIARDMGFKKYK